MVEQGKQDLRIVGETTSSGGVYRNVRITGECKFNSDVDCQKLSCIGETTVNGKLRTGELKFTGECDVKGDLDASVANGRGELKVTGRFRGERVKMTGNVEVGGDFECGELVANGAFAVNGLVSAEQLELKMFGPCRAREIGGGRLVVKRSRASALIHLFKPKSAGELIAESIEGDFVELHHTKAGVVRGNQVTIGPGCVIERVEYAQTLNVDKSSVVKETIRQA